MKKLLALYVTFLLAVTASTAGASDLTGLSAGLTQTCAWNAAGVLKCWGNNQYGQITGTPGAGLHVPTPVPGMSNSVTAVSISQADQFLCAIKQEALYCWGHNPRGQLGQGDTLDRATPTLVPGFGSRVTSVAVGHAHVCAVVNGSNYCWGDNSSGQLGLGTIDSLNHYSPVLQHATYAGTVAAGWDSTCMFVLPSIGAPTGQLRCWGNNAYGQLGHGNTVGSGLEGVDIRPFDKIVQFTYVTMGWSHTCALTDLHKLYCWGNNSHGQVYGGGATRLWPSEILPPYQSGGQWAAVSAGGDHTSMSTIYPNISNFQTVYFLGRGEFGQNMKGAHHYGPPINGDSCMDPFVYPNTPLCDNLNLGIPYFQNFGALQYVRGPVLLADGGYHTLFYATCGVDTTNGGNYTCFPGVLNTGGGNADGQLGMASLPAVYYWVANAFVGVPW